MMNIRTDLLHWECHDIVTVNQCQIVDEDYRKVLDCVLDYCTKRELPFYKKLRHEGYLRHLLVRRTTVTKQMLVAIVTTSDKECEEKAQWNELVEELKKLDLTAKLCGVMHIINDGLADVVKSDETRVLYGDEYIYEELLGLKFKIQYFHFSKLILLERKYYTARQESTLAIQKI